MNTTRHDEILSAVREAGNHLRLSADARDQIEQRLKGKATGATTLRDHTRRWPRRAAWALVAAAAIVAAMWILPAVDRETTISAAEVLGRSQQVLATSAAGVEVISYDLTLGGVFDEFLPTVQTGSFTVEETVDYDHPGRFKLLKVAPDGQVVAGAADDPLTKTRTRYVRLENRGLLVRFSDTPATALSVITIKRAVMQALIGLMQASDNTSLREVDRGGEPAYEIDLPTLTGTGLVELYRAKAVVGRADARLLDLDAQGAIEGQPFAITFDLRSRKTSATNTMPPGTFTIEPAPGDEVIEAGGGSAAPVWAVLEQWLRR